MKKEFFTIGYGGRKPEELTNLLKENNITAIIDVRLRPDRASMGYFKKAKSNDKGIVRLLDDHGIQYYSLIELGNIFLEYPDWRTSYANLLQQTGYSLLTRLEKIAEENTPFCLLCAEKRVTDCHREQIAEHLEKYGFQLVKHIE